MKRESKKPLEIIEQTETIEFELNEEKYKLTISNDLNTIEFILEELLSMNKNEYYLETNLKELQDKDRFFLFFKDLNEITQSLMKLVRKDYIDISKDDKLCKFKIKNPINDEEIFIELEKSKNEIKNDNTKEMKDSIPLVDDLRKRIEKLEKNNQELEKKVEDLTGIIKTGKVKIQELEADIDITPLLKSNIIGKKEEKIIRDFLQGELLSAELIFDTQTDGDTLEAFQKKCAGQFPTLIIIKTDLGKIFGGYATSPWKENGPIPDYNSFVYTLNPNNKYAVTMPKFGLFGYNKKENIMFQFGLVCFRVEGNCTKQRNNVIRGSNYEKDFINFIGGDHKFRVSRLEIFKLNF